MYLAVLIGNMLILDKVEPRAFGLKESKPLLALCKLCLEILH